jgi:hypothetical protein
MTPHIALGGPDEHGSFVAILIPAEGSDEPNRTVRTVKWREDLDALCKEWGILPERVVGDGLLKLKDRPS